MMRLVFTLKHCKCSFFVAPRVLRGHSCSSLPVSSACHRRSHSFTRHLSSGIPTWKDPSQLERESEEIETIELDKWKSVMRSKAALEEKQVSNEEEASDDDDDESVNGAGGASNDSSLLEATRELVEMWRQAGRFVPREITDEEVQTLAELTTKASRKKYLKYLTVKESSKKARKEKQQQKKAEREASIQQAREQDSSAEEGDDQRGREMKSTFLLQFWSSSLDKLLAWRSAQAMLFDQPLVFDMSYDVNMSKRELENTVSQLMEVEGCNRRATEPFHLHFCNLQPDGAYMRELLKRYSSETWDRLLITSSDRQHVDLFPCDQLVYLTADSPNVLRTFDHSKVYIIGAIVDRSIQPGLSLANAKRLKLATARLPLDEFLRWGTGAKNLTLDQMMRIMLTLKETGNWDEALKQVPTRKHDGFHKHQPQKISENRVKGLKKAKENGDRTLRSAQGSSEKSSTNAYRSIYRPQQEPGFTVPHTHTEGSRVQNKSTVSRVRTSFKNNMDGTRSVDRRKMWWNNE
ncbi:tRNA methyltransferase 10 homolog C [Betta splendens]|uniref:tRNA methyltransferase 10 homolog C n=1 Tax=Betta splendens TaxID=158456 RepID=A0A6P7LYA2_BETSP|nr:tRNA methyltransferase 10 homolog C [Betta splendens]